MLGDHLLRAATSVGANIVEAKSSSSRRDFIKFYEIALQSAHETLYWLGLLRDTTEVNKDAANKFLGECKEIAKMLSASIRTLKGKSSFKF